MTATLLPPAARSTVDSVREGLADIRDRISDIEAMPDWDKLSMPDWDKLAELPGHLVDRATGRNRRPRWPLVALGVLGIVGLAVGVAMFAMNRGFFQSPADGQENEDDGTWSPDGTTAGASTSHAAGTHAAGTHAAGRDAAGTTEPGGYSFPASDPIVSPMTPGLG